MKYITHAQNSFRFRRRADNEEPNTVLNGVVTFGKATYKLDFYTSVRTL
ncbi:hypothetical protein Plhal703r1_c38g0135491 [Plasmopara halstedii]